jgi:hypothetical protein
MVEENVKKQPQVSVEPWGVEIDHPRNCDVLLQSIPGQKMRSRITASRSVKDANSGLDMIPPDQSAFLGQFPPMPGMQLHVQPAKLAYTIIDPLEDDEDLCERIKKSMERTGPFRSSGKLKGVPAQRGTLDVHRIKTLVREMFWLVNSGEARVVKGSLPTMEQIEALPGRFLLNPGSRVANTQPMFADQWDAWVEQMSRVGG